MRFACVVICLLVTGCFDQSKLARISGNVSVNGTPVEKGSISFFPVDGKAQVTGAEIIKGQYSSTIPIGESKVQIRMPRKSGSKKLYNAPDSPVQDTFEESLPEKYNRNTELHFTAQKGSNQKDWVIP